MTTAARGNWAQRTSSLPSTEPSASDFTEVLTVRTDTMLARFPLTSFFKGLSTAPVIRFVSICSSVMLTDTLAGVGGDRVSVDVSCASFGGRRRIL